MNAATGTLVAMSRGDALFDVDVGLRVASISICVFIGGARAAVCTAVMQGLVILGFLLVSPVLSGQLVRLYWPSPPLQPAMRSAAARGITSAFDQSST